MTLRHYLPLIVIASVAIFLGLNRWSKTPQGAEVLDRFKLNLPVVGSIWQRYQIAVFSRMMSTLLAGGLPLVTSLETAGQSMSSRLIVMGIAEASKSVREGQTLAQSLEQTGVFPDLAVEMVEVGEATGALPTMLSSIAEFYEEDVQSALAAAMSLIEPVDSGGDGRGGRLYSDLALPADLQLYGRLTGHRTGASRGTRNATRVMTQQLFVEPIPDANEEQTAGPGIGAPLSLRVHRAEGIQDSA